MTLTRRARANLWRGRRTKLVGRLSHSQKELGGADGGRAQACQNDLAQRTFDDLALAKKATRAWLATWRGRRTTLAGPAVDDPGGDGGRRPWLGRWMADARRTPNDRFCGTRKKSLAGGDGGRLWRGRRMTDARRLCGTRKKSLAATPAETPNDPGGGRRNSDDSGTRKQSWAPDDALVTLWPPQHCNVCLR